MANHCWNYAVFTGEESKLKQLINSLEKTRIDFKQERELPEETAWIYGLNGHIVLGTAPPKVRADGGYEIDSYEAYGSKWFDCHWTVAEKEGKIVSVDIQGDSAWSPMLPLFEKICLRMKLKCYGNYEEPGMDFAGEFEFDEDGEVSHTEMSYREYQAENNPDAFWENLIENIDEGYFESIEDVYTEFQISGWTLTEAEKQELKKVHDEWLREKNDQD
jgi:hypothetical protein